MKTNIKNDDSNKDSLKKQQNMSLQRNLQCYPQKVRMKGVNNNTQALKSGIAYTFASFLTAGMAFITTPIFTRLMSKASYGAFNNLVSWQSILTVIFTLNLGATFISARFDYKDDFDSYVFSMVGLCFTVVIAFLVFINMAGSFAETVFDMEIAYINLLLIFTMFSQFVSIYQTKEQYNFHYRQSVVIGVVVSVSSSLISVLLVYIMQDKLLGRVIGYVTPTIMMGIIIVVILWRKGNIKITYWKYALPICLPYIPHLLSLTLLNSMDRIMIRKIWGEEKTALYSLAYTCSSVVTILMSSMNTAYSPWLARKLEKKEYKGVLKFSYIYISVFLFLVVGILLVAPEVLLILGGKSYMEAKYVMPPVMMGCAMQLLYTMHVNIEQYKKKTLGMALASVCAACINYILNLWLIPKYGYIAAAYTTWLGYLFLLLAHMFLVWRLKLGRIYNEKFILIMVIFGCFMMVLFNKIYESKGIRLILLTAYGMIFLFLMVKNRRKFKEFLAG